MQANQITGVQQSESLANNIQEQNIAPSRIQVCVPDLLGGLRPGRYMPSMQTDTRKNLNLRSTQNVNNIISSLPEDLQEENKAFNHNRECRVDLKKLQYGREISFEPQMQQQNELQQPCDSSSESYGDQMIDEFDSGGKFEPMREKADTMTFSETQKMNLKTLSKSKIKSKQKQSSDDDAIQEQKYENGARKAYEGFGNHHALRTSTTLKDNTLTRLNLNSRKKIQSLNQSDAETACFDYGELEANISAENDMVTTNLNIRSSEILNLPKAIITEHTSSEQTSQQDQQAFDTPRKTTRTLISTKEIVSSRRSERLPIGLGLEKVPQEIKSKRLSIENMQQNDQINDKNMKSNKQKVPVLSKVADFIAAVFQTDHSASQQEIQNENSEITIKGIKYQIQSCLLEELAISNQQKLHLKNQDTVDFLRYKSNELFARERSSISSLGKILLDRDPSQDGSSSPHFKHLLQYSKSTSQDAQVQTDEIALLLKPIQLDASMQWPEPEPSIFLNYNRQGTFSSINTIGSPSNRLYSATPKNTHDKSGDTFSALLTKPEFNIKRENGHSKNTNLLRSISDLNQIGKVGQSNKEQFDQISLIKKISAESSSTTFMESSTLARPVDQTNSASTQECKKTSNQDIQAYFFSQQNITTKIQENSKNPIEDMFFSQQNSPNKESSQIQKDIPKLPKKVALNPFLKAKAPQKQVSLNMVSQNQQGHPPVPSKVPMNPFLKAAQGKKAQNPKGFTPLPAKVAPSPFQKPTQSKATLNSKSHPHLSQNAAPIPQVKSLNSPQVDTDTTVGQNQQPTKRTDLEPLSTSNLSEKSFVKFSSLTPPKNVEFSPVKKMEKSPEIILGNQEQISGLKSCLRPQGSFNQSKAVASLESEEYFSSQNQDDQISEKEKSKKTNRILKKAKSNEVNLAISGADQQQPSKSIKRNTSNQQLITINRLQTIDETEKESEQNSVQSDHSEYQISLKFDQEKLAGSDEAIIKGKAFASGDMRDTSVDLLFIKKNESLLQISLLKEVNSLEEFVKFQANGLGLDPDIFLRSQNFDSSKRHRQQNQLSSESFINSSYQSSQSIFAPEVEEVVSTLNQEQKIKPIWQLKSQDEKLKEENLLLDQSQEIKKLIDLSIKNKLQLQILQYYSKKQKQKDDDKIQSLNSVIKVLSHHETQINKMSEISLSEKYELHFAFCFASPLVILGRTGEKINYKKMEQLNFLKEFQKIRESMESAKVKLRLIKSQCTLSSLNNILSKNPLGIHFSGHGLLNNKQELGPDLFRMYEGQGNLLLLEKEDGQGHLVSTEDLKQMIQKNYNNMNALRLVVVATCHSEFVGEIFQEAGAKHVICIQQQNEVADDAVITFTDSFYGLLFNKNICDAFEQAQKQVELTHSKQQASIFKILLYEDSESYQAKKKVKRDSQIKLNPDSQNKSYSYKNDNDSKHNRQNYSKGQKNDQAKQKDAHMNKSDHKCCIFGPFDKGKLQYIEPFQIQLRNMAPLQTTLIGRWKDQFNLISEVLNNKAHRLFTLSGMAGVGKSSLVLSSLNWMAERDLLRGGSIYCNARDIRCSQAFTRKLCNQLILIESYKDLFQGLQSQVGSKQDSMKLLKHVIQKLYMVKGDILLVIDNCEDLISSDKTNFRKLVSYFLKRSPSLKILLASRVRLVYAAQYQELSMQLDGLSRQDSAKLFTQMTRVISQNEKNQLINIQQDLERFPINNGGLYRRPKFWHEHHLFTLLNGNPQSIILTASVLQDQIRQVTLSELYKMLSDDSLMKELRQVEIDDHMLTSLRVSMHVSVQNILEARGEAIDLFFLLGLLPGGLIKSEIDVIWQQGHKKLNKSSQEDKLSVKSQNQKQNIEQSNINRAYMELLRAKIVEGDEMALDQSFDNSSDCTTQDKMTSLGFHKKVIRMPEYVRNFSEGLIDDQRFRITHSLIAEWLLNITKRQYLINEADKRVPLMSEFDLERLEKNFYGFLERVVSEYQYEETEDKFRRQDTTKTLNLFKRDQKSFDDSLYDEDMKEQQEQGEEESYDISSENPIAGFLDEIAPLNKSRTQIVTQSSPDTLLGPLATFIDEPDTCDPQPFNAEPIKSIKFANVQQAKSARQLQEIPTKMCQTKTQQRRKTAQSKKIVQIYDDNWNELHEAETAIQDIENIKPEVSIQINSEKHLAFGDLISIGGLNIVEQLEENYEQDIEYHFQNARQNKLDTEREESKKRHPGSYTTTRSTIDKKEVVVHSKSLKDRFEAAIKLKYKQVFDTILLQKMRFKRGTLCKPIVKEQETNNNQQESEKQDQDYQKRQKIEESVILYYIATKICNEEYQYVKQMTSKSLVKMFKSSFVFRGNVRRLQAFCLMKELEKEPIILPSSDDHEVNYAKQHSLKMEIKHCLKRAIISFKKQQCKWGLGLTHLQAAIFINLKMKRLQEQNPEITIEQQFFNSSKKKSSFKKAKSYGEQIHYLHEASELKEKLEKHKHQFSETIGSSILCFTQINHYRGLTHAYKVVREVYRQFSYNEDQLTNYIKIIPSSPVATSEVAGKAKSEVFSDLVKMKHSECYKLYRQSCDDISEQKREIFMQRVQGEEFSLMTEIVNSQKVHKMFDSMTWKNKSVLKDAPMQNLFMTKNNTTFGRLLNLQQSNRSLRQISLDRNNISLITPHKSNDAITVQSMQKSSNGDRKSDFDNASQESSESGW